MKTLFLVLGLSSALAFANLDQFSRDHLQRIRSAVAQKCGVRTPLQLVSLEIESHADEHIFSSVFHVAEFRVHVVSILTDVYDYRTQDWGTIEVADVRCEKR